MKVLVTGCAGFIGMHVSEKLLQRGDTVLGIDNLNAYYDVALKESRLKRLDAYPNFSFRKIDLTNLDEMNASFDQFDPQRVVHLAAQAGDVVNTGSDTTALNKWIGFAPNTSIDDGITKFVQWYKQYYRP